MAQAISNSSPRSLEAVIRQGILIRVDAGLQIGLGHLQRTLSLALALQSNGVASRFLVNEEGPATERVRRFGLDVDVLRGTDSWSEDDALQTVAAAARDRYPAVVVDSDREGHDFLAQLRQAGLFVCAIEDLAPHPFPCQMVVNGDVHAMNLAYESTTDDTEYLLGMEYSILRPEFWDVPARAVRPSVEHVLVTFGGSDPFSLTPGVIRALDELPASFAVTVIVGPFFGNAREIEAVVREARHSVQLLRSPTTVRDEMLEADVAISAAGQTLYELACTGCPAIAVEVARNQHDQLVIFDRARVIRSAGRAGDRGAIGMIRQHLCSLLSSVNERQAMSDAGRRLIDGRGAVRVAQALAERLWPS